MAPTRPKGRDAAEPQHLRGTCRAGDGGARPLAVGEAPAKEGVKTPLAMDKGPKGRGNGKNLLRHHPCRGWLGHARAQSHSRLWRLCGATQSAKTPAQSVQNTRPLFWPRPQNGQPPFGVHGLPGMRMVALWPRASAGRRGATVSPRTLGPRRGRMAMLKGAVGGKSPPRRVARNSKCRGTGPPAAHAQERGPT